MTLNSAVKDWLAINAGSGRCFAPGGISYRDGDGIAHTGGTGDVLNAFVVAHLVGTDSAVIIASMAYTGLKTMNDSQDITIADVTWIYNNDGAPAGETRYCAAAPSPTPTPVPTSSPTTTPSPTASPSPTPAIRSYPPAGGLVFSGAQTVTMQNTPQLNINDNLTIEMWIKINTWGEGELLLNNDTYQIMHRGGWSGNKIYFLLNSDLKVSAPPAGAPPYPKLGDSAWDNRTGISSLIELQAGLWYNVTATKTGNTIAIYINGLKRREVTAPSDGTINFIRSAAQSIILGYKLNGTIGEFRIYNRGLSAAEVASNNSGNVSRDGLILEHVYTQGHSRDMTGNGNNGTVNGAIFAISVGPTLTPQPSSGIVGAFEFRGVPTTPEIIFDLTNMNMHQNASDGHLEINMIKIKNIVGATIYIAEEIKIFPGTPGICPTSGHIFNGMNRLSTQARTVRITSLSPGEEVTLNMDFYQPGTIAGLNTICMYVHGTYDRTQLENEVASITG